MKPGGHHEPDASLDKLLTEWKVNPALPPRFQERVWHRIALAEDVPSDRSTWASLVGRVQALLAHPRLAAGYVTALLVVGFAAGWARGLEKRTELDQQLGSRYVQVINPYEKGSH
ncbi:MAG: hypothetical protein AB9869_16435 [Verrucomicrobiia bacterium]